MENNEVMEIMETENNAVNEDVELVDIDELDEQPNGEKNVKVDGNDYAKKFGMALACGALGAIGAAVANDVVIPLAKKAIHKGIEWIKSKRNKKQSEETEVEPAMETETPKETKKKTEKK